MNQFYDVEGAEWQLKVLYENLGRNIDTETREKINSEIDKILSEISEYKKGHRA